jgi:hypothetical protein
MRQYLVPPLGIRVYLGTGRSFLAGLRGLFRLTATPPIVATPASRWLHLPQPPDGEASAT